MGLSSMSTQDHGHMQQYTRVAIKSWAKHMHYESHCPAFRLLARRRTPWFSNGRSYHNNNNNIYVKCPKTSKWSWNYIYVLFIYICLLIFTTMSSPPHQVVLRPLDVLRIDIYCSQLKCFIYLSFLDACVRIFIQKPGKLKIQQNEALIKAE